ncbi:hypothetical protein ACT7DP_17610 [Bacillus paranthracis]
MQNTEVLAPTYAEEMKKIVVFVPETHAEEVRKALGDAGAGHIGNYSHCTFNSEGTGTFVPQEGQILISGNWTVRARRRSANRNDYSSFTTTKSD